MDVVSILLGISVILFLGFIAEFIFQKMSIPDVLILMIIGFVIGPYALGYVAPSQIQSFAPIFTTFALLFLMYEGAFDISLESLAKGAAKSLQITILNFILCVIITSGIMYLFGYDILTSVLVGFVLSSISAAFVIPILKQLNVTGETFSMLTLESALTDVLSIVFAFTVMQLMEVHILNFQTVFSQIASIFAVAGVIGIIAGLIWIVLVIKVFQDRKSYMITIAYLVMIYVITEYLNGNGAIAALFFGLVLKNSKLIVQVLSKLFYSGDDKEKRASKYAIDAISPDEEFFYSQISFLLKTFFFVYIGILINLSDTNALMIGAIIAIAIMIARQSNRLITKKLSGFDQKVVRSTYARGIASAAVAQVIILKNIPKASELVDIIFAVIIFTIFLSSINVFSIKRSKDKGFKEEKTKKAQATT